MGVTIGARGWLSIAVGNSRVSAIPAWELTSLKEVKGLSLKNWRNSFKDASPHSRPCLMPSISTALRATGVFRAPKAPDTVSVAAVRILTRSASLKDPSTLSRLLKVHVSGLCSGTLSWNHLRNFFLITDGLTVAESGQSWKNVGESSGLMRQVLTWVYAGNDFLSDEVVKPLFIFVACGRI